jgi:hypothetical protein
MEEPITKSCTISELAAELKVERRTLYNWLLPIRKELLDMYPQDRNRLRILMPKQVRRIKEFVVAM